MSGVVAASGNVVCHATSVIKLSAPNENKTNACAAILHVSYWVRTSQGLANGSVVYTDDCGLDAFSGDDKWFSTDHGEAMQISSIGIISNLQSC